MVLLNEDTRNQLIQKSKHAKKERDGKNRYEKRLKSRIVSSVREYNSMDMNKLFRDDILTVNVPVKGETDNYLVKISFGGFCKILRDRIAQNGGKLELRDVVQALTIGFNKNDVYVYCTCLHPDTKIKLLDGRTVTVEELEKIFQEEKEIWVYSVDENGDFKPGKVEKVWKTGESTQFTKVTLDNGETILTTPDHPYMLRDGSYCQAKDLVAGQSLMPLYFGEKNGYETVKKNTSGRYKSTYKVVAESLMSKQIEEARSRVKEDDGMKYDVAIHHKNFDKTNNSPSNLQVMTAREHWDYHASLMSEKWKDEEFREKNIKISSENARKRNENPTQRMIEQRKEFLSLGRELNYDPERRKQQSELAKEIFSNFWNNMTEEERKKHNEKIAESQRTETARENHAKAMKNVWNSDKEEHKKKIALTRIKNTLKKMLESGEIVSNDSFNARREKFCPKIETYFSTADEAISFFQLNHKVLSVEFISIENPIPVYDIKVSGYENFMVNGVILHNCPDNFYRHSFHQTQDKISSGEPQNIPAPITNPRNDLGVGCKHIMLVLSNAKFLVKTASVIFNYINYMEKHYEKLYADVIYPAIYGKKYEKDVQLPMDDEEPTSPDLINKANQAAVQKGRFQKGNTQGIRFAKADEEEAEQGEMDI